MLKNRRVDVRKEIILSEPDAEVEKVRVGNAGLNLASGENFDPKFSVENLEDEPLTRGN